MKKRFKLLTASAAVACAFAAPGAHAEGVEFHGYVRAGLGGTSEGGNLQCFSLGGIAQAKYRLGNECDNYSEMAIALPFGKQDGAWAKYNLMLALQEKNASDYESVADDGFNIAARQNYFQAGGFFGQGALEDAKVWIGKRYYNRHDIHINDYFYWNNSGPGGGIEDIQWGPVKAAFAYHQNGGNGNGANDVVGKRYSARLYDLEVNAGGKLEAELVFLKGSTAGANAEGKGTMLMVEHTQSGVFGGYNKLAVVWGDKLGGVPWAPTYQGGDKGGEAGKQFRIHEQLYFDLKGTNISGMFTATYAKFDCCSWLGNGDKKWFSIGVRPQYNFSDNFSVAVEAGYDQTRHGDAPTAKLAKLTVAPQLSLSRGFWARPVLRGFVTYAKWNDAAGNAGTNGVFGDKRNGVTYGAQVEAWW